MPAETLDFSGLPDLPQRAFLQELARDLWDDATIVALWLGGSLARGEGDAYSDVDLRVAVAPADFIQGDLPASARRLMAERVAGYRRAFSEGVTHYHLLLRDGQIYDFLFQTTAEAPGEEARLVLGCRETAFAEKLQRGADPVTNYKPADPEAIRRSLEGFWIGQVKHLKVLHRGLILLAGEGERRMRQDLIRFYYIAATGNDCGSVGNLTIHTFTPVERAVRQIYPRDPAAFLGTSLRTQEEIEAAARETQEGTAQIGRRLASQLGFSYPEEAEQTVRRLWAKLPPV